MDIFAHILWANAGARGANKIFAKKVYINKETGENKKFSMSPVWTGFWGVFPDFFAFTIPFIIGMYNLLFNPAYEGGFGQHISKCKALTLLHFYINTVIVWWFGLLCFFACGSFLSALGTSFSDGCFIYL